MKRLLLALSLGVLAFGQSTSSRITGTITDPAGSSLPDATVTATNTETGVSFKTISGGQGEFAIPALPAATYRIGVAAKGFRTGIVNEVKLDAAVPATVNIKLEVGAVTETVEVAASAEVIQSASATVSSTLVGRQLVELPITTRNLLELVITQPG